MFERSARALLAVLCLHAHPVSGQTPAFHDAHVHLNDPDSWIESMEEWGIGRAVVFRGRSASHEDLLDARARWPERIYPFVSVSPEHREYRAAWEQGDVGLADVVDSLLASGAFHGIGEISVSHFPSPGFPEADFSPSGAVMRAILDVARTHGVPVSLHVEITRLRELSEILLAYPDVDFILAHGSYTPLFLAERLLRRHPNLTYELSARTWPSHPRSPEYSILRDGDRVWPQWLALVESAPDRFIVGTDAALRSSDSDRDRIASVLNFLEQLTPESRALVATGNFDRLLGLPPGSD